MNHAFLLQAVVIRLFQVQRKVRQFHFQVVKRVIELLVLRVKAQRAGNGGILDRGPDRARLLGELPDFLPLG